MNDYVNDHFSRCAQGVKLINIEYSEPKFTDNMICARGSDPENMQDACRGDSGGPLVQKVIIEICQRLVSTWTSALTLHYKYTLR